jgi:hypothetical protein
MQSFPERVRIYSEALTNYKLYHPQAPSLDDWTTVMKLAASTNSYLTPMVAIKHVHTFYLEVRTLKTSVYGNSDNTISNAINAITP